MTQRRGRILESHRELLDSRALAHVATLAAERKPQSNPVWFDRGGEHVKFSQTRTRQKYRDPTRDPRVALSRVDPEHPCRHLESRVAVERIDEDPDLDVVNPMSEKYRGVYPCHDYRPGDERTVGFERPERVTSEDGQPL